MGVNKVEEAAMVPAECGLREAFGYWIVKKNIDFVGADLGKWCRKDHMVNKWW